MSAPARLLSPAELAAARRWKRRPAVEPLSAEDILDRLEAVRRNGEGRWMARCPAHGDRSASLSIREGEDGRVLMHCFAGCKFEEIASALHVEPQQLFPPSPEPWRQWPPRRDREREAREAFDLFVGGFAPVPPERVQSELRLIGLLLCGGIRAFADLPPGFDVDRIRTPPLRLLFAAIAEVAAQGTPRRWFSALALSRECDRVGGAGYAQEQRVFRWARLAVGAVRGDQE